MTSSALKTAALALLVSVAAVTASAAQDKEVQLKISLWVPPSHPLVPATKDWAASIEKASGGTIKSVVFPSEQMGKAVDHYDMARDGIADVAYINPGYQPGRFPVIAVGTNSRSRFRMAAKARARWTNGIALTPRQR